MLKKTAIVGDVSDEKGTGVPSTPSDNGSISSTSSETNFSEPAFRDVAGKTCLKGAGELSGKRFAISNCTDSVLALLDHTSSVSIESCNNCIIICGPCRGSVFLHGCNSCLILASCQQFRLHNSRDIEAHLHCTTKPTIEESDLIVAPLLMSYKGMEADMRHAGLDRSLNRWRDVQNFTPDLGQFRLMPFDPFANGAIGSEVITDELLEQLATLMEEPDAHELLLGPS